MLAFHISGCTCGSVILNHQDIAEPAFSQCWCGKSVTPFHSLFLLSPLFFSFAFPSISTVFLPFPFIKSRSPLIQLGVLGSTINSTIGVWAEPQLKLIVHFSLKICHLVTTILMILLRIY